MPTQKILEYKNIDWMKGISAQANVPVGGLFQEIFNCDPFEQGGLLLPSLSPATQSLGTIPQVMNSWDDGAGNAYLYVVTPSKLYQVLKNSPYTVTDVTAQIDQHLAIGTANNHIGSIIYQGKYVYASITSSNNGYISAGALPVASGTDVLLHDGYNIRDVMKFCVGPDGNLYYIYGQGQIGEITSVAGTSGNANVFNIDPGFTPRDIQSDGRYLVILADNNAQAIANRIPGGYKCKVYFWDMVQATGANYIIPDAVWELNDSYLIGGTMLDNALYFFGFNGLYICNSATAPKMIRPFPTGANAKMGRPINPYQITGTKGSVYWVDGTVNTSSYIYAYGNPITGQQKIFYIPYSTQGVNGVSQCLIASGNNFIMGNDNPALWFFNVGSTRGQVSFVGLDTNMEAPYTYDFVKVVLAQQMSSGQSVEVTALGNGGQSVLSSETQSYNSAFPKQSLLFRRTPSSTNQPTKFEDITLEVNCNGGAALQRVAAYATPADDTNNEI